MRTRAARTVGALAVIAALGACGVSEDLEAVDPEATRAASSAAAQADDEASDAETTEAAQEPAAAADLKVVESAFGKDDDRWWYVVLLENPNTDAVFDLASIDIEALDAEGTILDSDSSYLTILPGKTAISGVYFDVADGTVSELNVRGPDASTAEKVDEIGAFTVADVKPTFDDWSTDVSGTVTSSFAKDQETVKVVVVARDAAGKILGGDFTYVDRLPAGGKAQFKVTFLGETLPKDATFTAYAQL